MAELRASLIRPEPAPMLPSVERLAPPPPLNLLAAEIEGRTRPGDVVVDLFGRGGWVARTAVARLRRSYTFESNALSRLLADVVLRPPDVRHFDAAVSALGSAPHGQGSLRQTLNDLFASRCPTCGRSVVVDEFIWDGDAETPFRKSYHCAGCRGQTGNAEQRAVPTDAVDASRARHSGAGEAARRALRGRFPTPPGEWATQDQLLELYTPRTLVALHAILGRLDDDLRAAPIEAALRLALLHVLLPASKLNSYPGRVAALRIVHGRVRPPGERQWRERNPWLLFEDGCRLVRGFVQRLEGMSGGRVLARFGDDLEALAEGASNVVLRDGVALLRGEWPEGGAGPAISARVPIGAGRDGDARDGIIDERRGARVRLVLTQPPIRWTTETLSFAYLATGFLLGSEAAAGLPLTPLFGPPPRGEWAWEAAALRRGLAAVCPVLASDARAVVLLEPGGPEAMVAATLGGVGAGYRLHAALLAESEELMGGTLEFRPPPARPAPAGEADAVDRRGAVSSGEPKAAGTRPGGLRDTPGRSPRAVPSVSHRPAGDERRAARPWEDGGRVGSSEASAPRGRPEDEAAGEPNGTRPFELAEVERAIADAAVATLCARGEPARYERLLGEVMVALDEAGHLRRLVGTRTYLDTEERAEQLAAARGLLGEPGTPDSESAAPRGGDLECRAEQDEEPLAGAGGGSLSAAASETAGEPLPAGASETARAAQAGAVDESTGFGEGAVRTERAPNVDGDGLVDGSVSGSGHEPWNAEQLWETRGADHVAMLLELIDGELRRPDHPRLQELEPGRWWLRSTDDMRQAAVPLSDRLEWAVFSLLSTTGGLSESAFYERIASMFRGHDMPDESLVRACLESYQSRASTPELLRTADDLQARHAEHTELIGRLVEYGHRLGMRCWVHPHEQRRPWQGVALGDLLSDVERRAYLPLVARGPADALEATDCIWYVRGKATFLFEVGWTAMLSEPVLRKGTRIPQEETLVRFLVVVPERVELIRFKLARSLVLRAALDEGNWHFLKSNHLRALVAQEEAGLGHLEPFLGLDPAIERAGVQLPLFAT